MKLVKECVDEVAYLIMELWSDNSLNEAVDILIEYLDNDEAGVFVKEVDSHYVGLAMCSLRHDYVEGCETSPVGYLEGIVVDEAYRNKGIATELCKECEEWAKMAGCSEFASDCEIDNASSLQFHLNIGFSEENRTICFRKEL